MTIPGTPAAHRRLAWIAVALLALAASATGLANGFTYDDHHIIATNERVHDAGNALGLFAQTYWPPRNGSALYRPFTMLAFLGQWLAGGGSPFPFHLVSVLAYTGVSLAVLALAARLLPFGAAWVAAAAFAVHPVHVEAVGNVVGQSELWVGLAFALATLAYLRMRTRQLAGMPAWRDGAAVVILFALACLSKEHGIVLPAILAAAELAIVRDTAPTVPLARRLRQVAPFFGLLAAVALAYLLVRTRVVGGLVDDTPHIVFNGRPAATRLWTMLGVSGEWLRLLLFPAHLASIYGPPGTPTYHGFAPELLAPALALVGLTALGIWAWRARPVFAFGLVWIAVSLLPTSNLFFATGVLLAERTLFVPSIGFALVVGDLAVWAIARARAAGPGAFRLAGVGVGALLALGAVRSALRQSVWKDNDSLFAAAVVDEPLSYRAQFGYGGQLFEKGMKREGEQRYRIAMKLQPRDSDVRMVLGHEYHQVGLCGPAIPLYEEALTISPRRPDARAHLVSCLLAEARFVEARTQAQRGLTLGFEKPAFRKLLAIADSALAAEAP